MGGGGAYRKRKGDRCLIRGMEGGKNRAAGAPTPSATPPSWELRRKREQAVGC